MHMSALRHGLIISCACLAVVLATPRPMGKEHALPRGSEGSSCPGKITSPLAVSIEADEAALRPGVPAHLSVTITSSDDVAALTARVEGEGPIGLESPSTIDVGPLAAGDARTFEVTVRPDGTGRSAVHLVLEGVDFDGRPVAGRRGSLFLLVRPEDTLAATSDFQDLDLRAIRVDQEAGRLTPVQAEAARLAIAETPARHDLEPSPAREATPEEMELNRIVGAPMEGNSLTMTRSGTYHALAGTITVQGNVQWTDENGTTHPVFGASVNILDDDGILGTEFITAVPTDTAGNYQAVVNNDDGLLQGDRDIFVRVFAGNTLVDVKDGSNDTYRMTSPTHNETPSGTTVTENFTALNNGGGEAWSVFQAGTWVAAYAQIRNGGPLASVDISWPNAGGTNYNGGLIKLLQLDRWDWDVTMHEYGHHIQAQIGIANSPGGNHGNGCSSDARNSKDQGVRLAWGEGWPSYNGAVSQQVLNLAALGVPRVGDVNYDDLEDQTLVYSLEANTPNQGEDDEAAVQRLLWDLYDNANEGRDPISRSDTSIWTTLDAANPGSLSAAWASLRSGQTNAVDLQMGSIATLQKIGPTPSSPTAGTVVTPSNANFSWTNAVGCSSTWDGNQFDLVFYNAGSFAKVLTVANLGTNAATLTAGQIATLTASGHAMLWAVEGRNTDSPGTGPYLGDNVAITVNQPPVANAGTDQPGVECASHTTTSVLLNGTASSDPDGDTLTYTWSAGGVTFDDAHSATPTGQFGEGTTVVTLTVSDGIQTATDTVSITVVDTTPPVITCPSNVTVECTGNCGIQADDPQLTAFFAGVSATDVCDATPTITNDALAFIPLGTTTVTFTATDDDLNAATCTATITVQDTIPPVITVALDRLVLRPPNHKLVDIHAAITVTDICDPNASFVLTSITSNEPDNGLGDGDTAGDIQGAEIGTADTTFKLRSERSGTGFGRIYTIVYTASDKSGNTTTATVVVRVPHNATGPDSRGRRLTGGWSVVPASP
jgi:hypothetical protein